MRKPFLISLNSTKEDLRKKIKNIDYRENMYKILGNNSIKRLDCKKRIIIFTRIDDPEIDYLGYKLLKNGIDYMRVNAEDLLRECLCSLCIGKEGKSYVSRKGEKWDLDDVDAIWFRHFSLDCVERINDKLGDKYINEQWDIFFNTICNIGIPTISKYDIERYITKPIQLIEAEKIGFKIPKTYITNSFQDINSLKEKVIFGKTVKHHNIEIIPNLLVHVYGRSFVPSQICKDDFQLTPTIIQNLLNIKREVRITFFGDRLFGTEYQNVEMEDWHDQGIYGFSMREYQVENDLREKIYKLMSNLHLKLGTIDLVNVNDEWYFLEVNPNGDWRWIESQSNQRMSMACIDFLKEMLKI